jgi:hypothetical protein
VLKQTYYNNLSFWVMNSNAVLFPAYLYSCYSTSLYSYGQHGTCIMWHVTKRSVTKHKHKRKICLAWSEALIMATMKTVEKWHHVIW